MYSIGEVVNFLLCDRLATLEGEAHGGLRERPAPSANDDFLWVKGNEHELHFVDLLRSRGMAVAEVPPTEAIRNSTAAVAATEAAMRSGAAAIHGALLTDGKAFGVADFLLRVERPSRFGNFGYEVADAKLALSAKPAAVVQVAGYTELLEAMQSARPEQMHLVLGDGEVETIATADVAAYYRRLRERFLQWRERRSLSTIDRIDHCSSCRWQTSCAAERRATDHLSLVARISRAQIRALREVGIGNGSQLARALDAERPRRMGKPAFERLRAQARLQERGAVLGPLYELLPPEPLRGFARLPEPSEGDVYFDMEGDRFAEGGALEYLFGVAFLEHGELQYRAYWGHDKAAERRAFEQLVDFIADRRHIFPSLHVYHYAPYEPSALKRLMGHHATREDAVDAFLREGVFVDLYAVVKGALRVSFESYSLKSIETLFRGPREGAVKDALGSVLAYERWRAVRAAAILDEIEAYNRDDCASTFELHRWLLARRDEAEQLFDCEIAPFVRPETVDEKILVQSEESDSLREALLASGDPAKSLAAHLLLYHRREAKPEWWSYFRRLESTIDELIDDTEAIGGLTVDEEQPLQFERRSQIVTLRFPPQQHRLRAGATPVDRRTGSSAGTIVAIDDDRGILSLKRGLHRGNDPFPVALVPPGPRKNDEQREALRRLAASLLAEDGRYRALAELLARGAPQIKPGADLSALVLALDQSYLFVQGPPGSGKTWAGARAIVECVANGKRVGVTANSHKAIHKMLEEVERVAFERGVMLRGLKKSTTDPDSVYQSRFGFIESEESTSAFPPQAGVTLAAGTAWLFARGAMDQALDVLFIDEAGQVALADALAMGTSARSLVLLGDPLQLAQVSQGTHPEGCAVSVLEHLLGSRATVAPGDGVFLGTSYRMHPDVCSFISEAIYDGRLSADAGCERQGVVGRGPVAGAGLRYIPVPHDGNTTFSDEEAQVVALAVESVLVGDVVDRDSGVRAITPRDVLVVAPYNAQVQHLYRALRERGIENVRVGTVDKFQGQEAHVVFFSMATSSRDDLPHDFEFLFSRNRLNVAISRARSLAVLVCNPGLLDSRCATLEQIALVNTLCRFVEEAQSLSPRALERRTAAQRRKRVPARLSA